jgi:osmotically-inducible protein OsmY
LRLNPNYFVLLAVTLAGCNPRDAGDLAQDARNLSRHTGQALGSATLAGKVNTVLSLRKGVDMSGLHIEAQDGVVTIGGHVRNAEERRRIVQTVNGIRGVDKVIDQMRVQ